jgi:hypothetical protein
MIMGPEPRLLTCVELLDRGMDPSDDLADDLADDTAAPDHRDRGGFLTPRLYPTTPLDPWQPVSGYLDIDMDPFEVAFAEALEA